MTSTAEFAGPRGIEEHHPYQHALSSSRYALVFACALNLDQLGLVDARSGDALLSARSRPTCEWGDLNDFSRLCRFI